VTATGAVGVPFSGAGEVRVVGVVHAARTAIGSSNRVVFMFGLKGW
jgi:hypothetical protein